MFRRPIRTAFLLTAALAAGAQPERSVPTERSYPHAKLKPVDLLSVRLTDDFWKPRIETSINTSWHDLGRKFEQHGHIEPFRIIAEGRREQGRTANNDEFVYKWMEAGGYYAGYPSSCGAACNSIRADLDKMIDLFFQEIVTEFIHF